MPLVLIGAGLAGVLVALLLLLFVAVTLPTWTRAISALLGGIPVIGGWVESNAISISARLIATMAVWAEEGLGPLVALVQNLFANAYNLTLQLPANLGAIWWALYRVSRVYLPAAVAQLTVYAQAQAAAALVASLQAVAAARAAAARDLQAAKALLAAEIAQAAAQAHSEYLQALAYTDRSLAAAVALLSKLIAQAVAQARADFRAAETLARLLSSQDRAYTASETAKAIGHADQVGQQARTYSDQQTAAAEAKATAESNALNLALTSAIGTVAAAVQSIEDSPCMQQCDTLGSLGGALSAIDLAAILALVAEAARDPEGTARFVDQLLSPVAQEAEAVASSVLGLKVA